MTVETVAEHRDRRYLELEKLVGGWTAPALNKLAAQEVTLIFEHNIERFPTVILDTWKSCGAVAIMAPAFGPLARYQALKAGYFLMVSAEGRRIADGERLLIDPERRCWQAGQDLGGMLTVCEPGAHDMVAFLAAASDDKTLLDCLPDVVEFGLDPAVSRF